MKKLFTVFLITLLLTGTAGSQQQARILYVVNNLGESLSMIDLNTGTVVNDVDEATVDSIGTSVVGEPSSTDSHAARTIIKQITGAAHRRPISVSDPDAVSVV